MRLSRKTDYALRTMVDLAQQNGNLTPVSEIAERQGISTNFLEQILLVLKGGDLVASRRGKHGGYFLARSPSEITLADIVHLTEGAVGLSNCVHNPELCIGGRNGCCPIREVWEDIHGYISTRLESVTVADMCHRARELLADPVTPDYVI